MDNYITGFISAAACIAFGCMMNDVALEIHAFAMYLSGVLSTLLVVFSIAIFDLHMSVDSIKAGQIWTQNYKEYEVTKVAAYVVFFKPRNKYSGISDEFALDYRTLKQLGFKKKGTY